MSYKLFFISAVMVFVTLDTHGRELTAMTLDISGSEAKQDAFDQAIEQATQRVTEDLLGPERMARFWPTLRPKLLTHWMPPIQVSACRCRQPIAAKPCTARIRCFSPNI